MVCVNLFAALQVYYFKDLIVVLLWKLTNTKLLSQTADLRVVPKGKEQEKEPLTFGPFQDSWERHRSTFKNRLFWKNIYCNRPRLLGGIPWCTVFMYLYTNLHLFVIIHFWLSPPALSRFDCLVHYWKKSWSHSFQASATNMQRIMPFKK